MIDGDENENNNEFFFETSVIEKNKDSIEIMDFLASPDCVSKMMSSIDSRNPALAGVVEELENRFADCEGFSLNHNSPDKSAKNRRNIGWMVKYILREFGYTPTEYSDRTRIGKNSGSKYFGNASLYEQTNKKPAYFIYDAGIVASREWTAKDIIIDKSDIDYEVMKEGMKKLNLRRKKLVMSIDFLADYLRRTGYSKCISNADMLLILKGKKVPATE